MDNHSLSIRARKKVKAQIEKAERERKISLFQKRMELAREGALQFKNGNFKASAQAYYQYLAILERSKEVRPGMLQPKDFDSKKDIAELLLLSGVFWDLAKLHDRVSRKNTDRLDHYLDLFVIFSKGRPFQHVSAELIRKYLMNGSPQNRGSFKAAHIRLGGGKCFIATAVEDYCAPKTVPALRYFRDDRLSHIPGGKLLIRCYYALSPAIAVTILRLPENIQTRIARGLDRLAEKILESV